MILYHFTTILNAKGIIKAGVIMTRDSLLDPRSHEFWVKDEDGEFLRREIFTKEKGPLTDYWKKIRVVFFTDTPRHDGHGWATGSAFAKTDFRFTVEVSDDEVSRWESWSKGHKIPSWWKKAIMRTGENANTWVVVERAIPAEEWRKIHSWAKGKLQDITEESFSASEKSD